MDVVEENIEQLLARMPENLTFTARAKWLLGEEAVDRADVASHANGVAYYSAKLAAFIGMDEESVAEIKFGAIIHDIGKLVIPDEVINFRGNLTGEARAIMNSHAMAGVPLLGDDAPQVVRDIAAYHHERYDGFGYNGLKGEEIPFAARIVQIADMHDALMQRRVYKPAMSEEQALLLLTNDPEDRASFGRYGSDPFLLRQFVMMRLVDVDFNASLSDEGRQKLTSYALSPPMGDFGTRLVDNWMISQNGARTLKYVDNFSGNEKTAEVRSAQGDLLAGPFGPRADHPKYSGPDGEPEAEQTSGYRR